MFILSFVDFFPQIDTSPRMCNVIQGLGYARVAEAYRAKRGRRGPPFKQPKRFPSSSQSHQPALILIIANEIVVELKYLGK